MTVPGEISMTLDRPGQALDHPVPGQLPRCPHGARELIAEDDKVVGRFTCSATHQGAWLGQAPTGRRFERVDEVWILGFRDGRIVHVWSLEDTLWRLRQLGLA